MTHFPQLYRTPIFDNVPNSHGIDEFQYGLVRLPNKKTQRRTYASIDLSILSFSRQVSLTLRRIPSTRQTCAANGDAAASPSHSSSSSGAAVNAAATAPSAGMSNAKRRRVEDRLAILFMGIVAAFLICHFPRVLLNFYEMLVIEQAMACARYSTSREPRRNPSKGTKRTLAFDFEPRNEVERHFLRSTARTPCRGSVSPRGGRSN